MRPRCHWQGGVDPIPSKSHLHSMLFPIPIPVSIRFPPPSPSILIPIPTNPIPFLPQPYLIPIPHPSCIHPNPHPYSTPVLLLSRPHSIQSLSPSHSLSRPSRPLLQVYSASNVELVTKTRTEHLSDQDKSRTKGVAAPPTWGRYQAGTVAPCPPTPGLSPQAPAPPSTPSWAWHSSTAPTMG